MGTVSKLCSRCFQLLSCRHRRQRNSYELKDDHYGNHTSPDRQASILRLCADLQDQDASELQLKVIKYLETQCDAEIAYLLLVGGPEQELSCHVVGNRVLPEETKFSGSRGMWNDLLQRGEPVFTSSLKQPERGDVERLVETEARQFMCVPVLTATCRTPVALACLVNKRGAGSSSKGFKQGDADVVQQCFRYTATVLTSTIAMQRERRLRSQTQALLNVAKHIFTHLDDLTSLLHEIMLQAKILTKAERCSLFLLDREHGELVAKVFDTEKAEEENVDIRIPADKGIAGHVATTGEFLNIHDAYSHPLFYKELDESTGFRTRNILCFPIQEQNGVITGVAELCNKGNGPYFTLADEEVAHSFSVYCAIAIVNCLMYQRVNETRVRNKLSNELMMYHMQVSLEEATNLAAVTIPTVKQISQDFNKFSYMPRSIPEDETPLACVAMFEDLGLINRWRIKRSSLAKFILMVKKGYRDPPYHNWSHAFSVGHFCHILVKNLDLYKYLDDIEVLSLLVACLCHDIDHRGTNNSFQVQSESVLATLYSSEGSVMERHHFAQTMCILNTEDCNIFENLSSNDYSRALDHVRDIILATDLAHHLRIINNLEHLVTGGFKRNEQKSRDLLLCLLMTSSDLSDQTKPWKSTKIIAAKIYEEFFSQGDLEKALGRKPQAMMDRDRANIPELQIGFIDGIALPVYSLLEKQFPAASPLSAQVKSNRDCWSRLNDALKRQGSTCSLETFQTADIAINERENQNGGGVYNHH